MKFRRLHFASHGMLCGLLLAFLVHIPASGRADPVTTHPRLWIRTEDLARLRSWATPANPMYANASLPTLQSAVNIYNSEFYPGGSANPNWPDSGDVTWVGRCTESYAEFFAFWSLVDPDASARPQHAERARKLLMYVIDRAALGQANAPFRYSSFATHDRSRWWGEAFPLTVDWIYPVLSAAEKEKIRAVFLRWCAEINDANQSPHYVPVTEPDVRYAANNYYTAHMRDVGMMGLALDAADDPDGALRSYVADATGPWLSRYYAIFHGTNSCSGGLHPEGPGYGWANLAFVQHFMLALRTAGVTDPAVYGPQIAMINDPYWTRAVNGFLHSLTPTNRPTRDPNLSYLGRVYEVANYGDLQRFWFMNTIINFFGPLGARDIIEGETARLPSLRWAVTEPGEGGSSRLYNRASDIWGNSYASTAILYFMLFDPAASPAADPRPQLPTTFVARPLGRILSRTAWTTDCSWFTYICSWNTIGHQLGCANQFEFYRKGEWLTKELSGYATDYIGATSDYHNTLAIQNDTPANLYWFDGPTAARGGQWLNGSSVGDPSVLTSLGTTYTFAQGDATPLYNRWDDWNLPNRALDVLHASRSIAWIKPDSIVVYDRAQTGKSGRFKRFNLCFESNGVVSGRLVTVTSRGGQKLFVHSLLPANATISVTPRENVNSVAEEEPMAWRMVVEDPTQPASVRFLHALQGADAGSAPALAQAIVGASGPAYDGAVIGNTAAVFPVNLPAATRELSYSVPAGVVGHLVSGLIPLQGYAVAMITNGGAVQVSLALGGNHYADKAGVLGLGSLRQPTPDATPEEQWAFASSGLPGVDGDGVAPVGPGVEPPMISTNPVVNDFDGDGCSDLAVVDPQRGAWFIRSLAGVLLAWNDSWGYADVSTLTGDYDGDRKCDQAVFDGGAWFIKSWTGPVIAWNAPWGWRGARPLAGDYSGDGRADLCAFDPGSGRWFIRTLSGSVLAWGMQWGWPGAKPVPGDYDGDGRWDPAVFDDMKGLWYVRTMDGNVPAWAAQWGWPGAKPVPGDYDGDGIGDLAVFNPLNGRWFIRTLSGTVLAWNLNWGWPGATVVPGDYDGDGRCDLALYDSSTGSWYIGSLSRGVLAWNLSWGWSGGVPAGAVP